MIVKIEEDVPSCTVCSYNIDTQSKSTVEVKIEHMLSELSSLSGVLRVPLNPSHESLQPLTVDVKIEHVSSDVYVILYVTILYNDIIYIIIII